MSLPSKKIDPQSGLIKPEMRLRMVVLPLPCRTYYDSYLISYLQTDWTNGESRELFDQVDKFQASHVPYLLIEPQKASVFRSSRI